MVYFEFKEYGSVVKINGIEYTHHNENGEITHGTYNSISELVMYIYANRHLITPITELEYLKLTTVKTISVGDLVTIKSSDGITLGDYRLVRVTFDDHLFINVKNWNRLDSRVFVSDDDKIATKTLEEFYNIKIDVNIEVNYND